MKQKDIVVILVAGFVAAVISIFVSQALFVPKKTKNLTAEKVNPISAQFNEPDKEVFNDTSIDPTQLIKIGDNNNTNPF